MRSYREDETARQADPKGDVDDLIFRSDGVRTVEEDRTCSDR